MNISSALSYPSCQRYNVTQVFVANVSDLSDHCVFLFVFSAIVGVSGANESSWF